MPETVVTGPDGKEYTVTHPEGATQDQIIAYARQQVASGALQADAPAPEAAPEPAQPSVRGVIEATPAPLRALANLPGSAQDLYQNTVLAPLEDPLGTLGAVGKLGLGSLQKFQDWAGDTLGPVAGFSPITWAADKMGVDYRAAPEAFAEALDERYGSGERAYNTLLEDPAGVLADVGGLAVPALARARTTTAPAINKVTRPAAENLMEGSAKFSTVIPKAQRKRMVGTMLDEGITPSSRGVDKLSDLVGEQGRIVDELLAEAQTRGSVPLGEVLRPVAGLRSTRGTSLAGGSAADDAVTQFIRDRIVDARRQGKTALTAEDLQRLKRDLYDQINWNARRQVDEVPVLEEARKTMARGAKEQIERLAPGVKDANEQFGRLLELQAPLERAASRIENRQFIGMGDYLGGGAGLAAGALGSPALGAAVFGISELLTNPRLAPATARVLNRLGRPEASRRVNAFMEANPNATTAAIAAYLDSLLEGEGALAMEE